MYCKMWFYKHALIVSCDNSLLPVIMILSLLLDYRALLEVTGHILLGNKKTDINKIDSKCLRKLTANTSND